MTGSSGDAARDRMQLLSFWRDLGAEFRRLPDPVWANTDAPDRLHASLDRIRGGDASLRSQFRHLASRGGLALYSGRGLGSDLLDAFWVWLDEVHAYLKEEKNPWCREFQSPHWKSGPTERRELTLSAIRPQHDKRHCIEDEADLLNRWVEAIQLEGMNELLIVTADDQGYVVIDDEREDRKYRACVLAGVTSLTCKVRAASNPGAREGVTEIELDCISVASADLCLKLGTEAFGRQIAPPVEQPATRPDGSATPAPVATPPTQRARVDAFLTRCNREYTGSGKIRRKDIWTLVHQTRTQFQRWQREAQEATDTDREKFEQILAMTPHDFIETVTKRRNHTR